MEFKSGEMMMGVRYSQLATPDFYRCDHCGATGVKLWRNWVEENHPHLLCAHCAAADQNKTLKDIDANGQRLNDRGDRTELIGLYCPAVPLELGDGYCGYTMMPLSGLRWWRRLPTLAPS